jgi:hypothetical protein
LEKKEAPTEAALLFLHRLYDPNKTGIDSGNLLL